MMHIVEAPLVVGAKAGLLVVFNEAQNSLLEC
jgi:hypothetical protein